MAIINLLAALLIAVHPYHVSTTEIYYKEESKSVEVSVKIFTGDLENTLKKNCKCKVDIIHPTDKPAVDKMLEEYINRHLQITIDGQAKKSNYVGYQQEEEGTWVYFEIAGVETMNKLSVKNSLLHDYEKEQVNMIHVKANGKDETVRLVYPENTSSFNL